MFNWLRKLNGLNDPTYKELDQWFKARPRDVPFAKYVKYCLKH